MKKIEIFKVHTNLKCKGIQVGVPFVRVNLTGNGCGNPGCKCSPPYYISLSNGVVGMTINLDESEANAIKQGIGEVYFQKRYRE
jgi:hypothetical protein